MDVPAPKNQHRITAKRLEQTVRLKIAIANPEIDQPNTPALPLYQRVGGKGGRQRCHRNLARLHPCLRQHCRYCRPDPYSQITVGCQRLGLSDDQRFIPN
ncbi:hypothetical protein P775_02435 [Puniceibacterium antarcticum]|uniref:Uncharacterized protein n=1 Tax=Puniceibacterium antarcticum TaxID=1206336 RepID=A0A2G8RK22_9RHOB|nr:hypothetical protein P775_02435 [Puniceibacterium antarcticum]